MICPAGHPDDIEIASGGTLLELAARGDVNGHWLTLTGDSARAAEAVAAAEAFLPGARTEFHRLLGRLASMVWREPRSGTSKFPSGMAIFDHRTSTYRFQPRTAGGKSICSTSTTRLRPTTVVGR
jgi:hypothetical protein